MSTLLNGNLEPAEAADILWFLPTHGDGRYLGTQEGAREVSLRYLTQIARAADDLGYYGVLLPTGRSCEDSWVIASSLVPLTERLRFLVALRPGLYEPAAAARMAATLDRLAYGVQSITPDIIEAQQKIADTFHKLGLLPKPITVRDAVWTPSS